MSIIKSHAVTLKFVKDRYTIVLLPLCDEHLPLLYKWNSDPEVLYWTEGGEDVERCYNEETVQEIYGGVSQNSFCFLVVVDDYPIGDCWLQRMNNPKIRDLYPGKDVRRIDMAIGEKEYWGKGIGTEFVSMLVHFAFYNEKVDVLHCFAEDYNVRSQRVWIKNGFRHSLTEELKQPQKGRKQFHFVLTREEYLARQDMPISKKERRQV